MITLNSLPINYEVLNDLYEHTDQSFCLNRVAVPLDEDSTRNYFLAVRSGINNGMPFDAKGIFLDGKLIGKAERTIYEDGSAELDLIIRKEYCGNGYGTEALNRFLTQAAQCTSFCAYIESSNLPAARVLEKSGFHAKRNFLADVMTPQSGTYALRTVEGTEYIRKGEPQ